MNMKTAVLVNLSPDYPWAAQFHYYPTLDSTNDRIRAMARQGAPHGTVLVADHQTGGHGRLGRTFQSPAGSGVYLSILLRPSCAPTELMHLTCAAAVAMCQAIEASSGITPGIKWTNDLVSGRRKLGGILTELGFTPQGAVDYAIVGIGINCCQAPEDFPPELRDMAGSLAMASGRTIDRSRVAAAMMEALYRMDVQLLSHKSAILSHYKQHCVTLGQDISLVRHEEIRHGKALDLDEDGALIVEFPDGHREIVNSGEVSVRGMYGYL